MGDLSKIDRAEAVILVGSDALGGETVPAQVDTIGTKRRLISASTSVDASDNVINPAKEDGNLASIKSSTDNIPTKGQAAMADSVPVTIANNQTPLPPASPVTGTITAAYPAAGSTVEINTKGYTTFGVQLSGTWSATLIVETSSDDGDTWVTSAVFGGSAGMQVMPSVIATITANGNYMNIVTAPFDKFRIKAVSFTSGTVNVTLLAGMTPSNMGFSYSSMIQNVVMSSLNASTSNLAAGATFVGAAESTLGVAGIQIMLKADQPCTVVLEQSLGNDSNWDISDSYTTFAGIGTGRTIQAIGAYFRLRVTNTGLSTTTYFRLGVALCPVVEVVPRSLGQKLASRSLSVTLATDNNGIATASDLVFSVNAELNFSTTAETNFVLLRNPPGSGRRCNLQVVSTDAVGKPAVCRMSVNPTGVTPGTAIVPLNRHIGSVVTSAMTASYSPTATPVPVNRVGTLSTGTGSNSSILEYEGRVVLEPGNDFLVTAQPGGNNTVISLGIVWMELLIAQ